MKKILMTILMATMILPIMVSAQETTDYYTNSNGATLSQEQYDYLINYFSENTLYSMTKEQIDLIKDERNLSKVTETKYIKIDEAYDENGNLIESTETEVSEDEALNYKESDVAPASWNTTYQTTMKKLYMQVVSSTADVKIVTITNTWLSIPKVKSYDVIALRPETASATINIYSNMISGYQKWDGNTVNYNSSSTNTKKTSSFTGKGGIGISMNIVDSVSSSLENSMTVYFLCGASKFTIAGTYQHATSDVSLSQSQNYSFSSTGYGGVLSFASSVSSKYDAMQGVKLTYNYADELYG